MAGKASEHFDVADNGKEFGLGTVLAAYYNEPFERTYEGKAWDVLNHMMGIDLGGEPMLVSMSFCKPFLKNIIPDLGGKLDHSLDLLHSEKVRERIDSNSPEERSLRYGWLAQQEEEYGNKIVVPALSDDQKSGFIQHYADYKADILGAKELERIGLVDTATKWANYSGLFSQEASKVLEARSLRENNL